MIKYKLKCHNSHEFESWFSNSHEFEKLKKNKLLSVPAADNTIRLAPPLIVTNKDIDKSISIINNVLREM